MGYRRVEIDKLEKMKLRHGADVANATGGHEDRLLITQRRIGAMIQNPRAVGQHQEPQFTVGSGAVHQTVRHSFQSLETSFEFVLMLGFGITLPKLNP